MISAERCYRRSRRTERFSSGVHGRSPTRWSDDLGKVAETRWMQFYYYFLKFVTALSDIVIYLNNKLQSICLHLQYLSLFFTFVYNKGRLEEIAPKP